jgi:hypothetical protein
MKNEYVVASSIAVSKLFLSPTKGLPNVFSSASPFRRRKNKWELSISSQPMC